mmetsp:Transcript_13008/g.38722  ORF Transcript_13008/g.38722 Transcript_13008/m.38722 type:complete len:241 (-) Transcript_13008:266-988(-)
MATMLLAHIEAKSKKIAAAAADADKPPSWRREGDLAAGTRYGCYEYALANQKTIKIDESYSSTGTRVWDTSVAMARMLERRSGDLAVRPGDRVLELGSGSGLLGMALQALGADVTMTEVQEVVPHLRRAVAANAGRFAAPPAVAALDWREDVADAFSGFDVARGGVRYVSAHAPGTGALSSATVSRASSREGRISGRLLSPPPRRASRKGRPLGRASRKGRPLGARRESTVESTNENALF